MRLKGYTGRALYVDSKYDRCVYIVPAEITSSTAGEGNSHESRQKLLLQLCWTVTMYKNHGQTVEKVVIDHGNSKANAGLNVLRLSQAKQLVGR